MEQTFVFTPGEESSSPLFEGALNISAVELDVLEASKHLLTSKRKAEELASIASCTAVCPQAKSGGGGALTRGWCACLEANYNFCGLGGIPRVATSVLQASEKVHCNINKQKSTHSSLILPCCPTKQQIYRAVEPVLPM